MCGTSGTMKQELVLHARDLNACKMTYNLVDHAGGWVAARPVWEGSSDCRKSTGKGSPALAHGRANLAAGHGGDGR